MLGEVISVFRRKILEKRRGRLSKKTSINDNNKTQTQVHSKKKEEKRTNLFKIIFPLVHTVSETVSVSFI